jgi:hypothetical protein
MHIGIKDLSFGTSTLSRPTWHYAKAPRSQRAQCPIVGTELGMLPGCQSSGSSNNIASDLRDAKAPSGSIPNWAPATGPPAVGCRPGASRGERPPPAPLGAVGRDSHQDTGTQELRPALSVNTQPNHVLPLAHFGAISDVYGGGMVRTDHHDAGERSGSTQQHKCICWWLVRNGI